MRDVSEGEGDEPFDGADDRSSTGPESLLEFSSPGPELEVLESELALLDDEVGSGKARDGGLSGDVRAGEAKEGVSSDSGKDLAVKRRGDEVGNWERRETSEKISGEDGGRKGQQ